eukprot:11200504-Alexandrium_andersonii.AAC.1
MPASAVIAIASPGLAVFVRSAQGDRSFLILRKQLLPESSSARTCDKQTDGHRRTAHFLDSAGP